MDKLKSYKEWIFGLLLIIAVIIFTASVVNQFKESSKKNMQEQKIAFEHINKEARERELRATEQRDSIAAINWATAMRLSKVEGELIQQTGTLNRMENSYNTTLKDLKKYYNEKNFVPTNATPKQQSDYLSNYKYQEYTSP